MELKLWMPLIALILLSQNSVIVATAFDDQSYYYTPQPPNVRSPPPGGAAMVPANCCNSPPPPFPSGPISTTPTTPTPCCGGGDAPPVAPPANCSNPPTPLPSRPISSTPTPPPPPYPFDSDSPPFTCDFWRNHPALMWGIYGWVGTVGSAFGPVPWANMNFLEALSNNLTDGGFRELYREATAALLNSLVPTSTFPYTTTVVRESFVRALASNQAAAAQAQLFNKANEGTF